jgi:hypothetical protein
MSILQKTNFVVIIVVLFSPITLTLNGYCDDWVLVGINENYSVYYHKSSVKIDKEEKIIQVTMKRIYTEKGKTAFNKANIDKQIYDKINYVLILYLFNYHESTYNVNNIAYYTKSGEALFNHKYQLIWDKIIPNSENNLFFKKVLQDFNIQK